MSNHCNYEKTKKNLIIKLTLFAPCLSYFFSLRVICFVSVDLRQKCKFKKQFSIQEDIERKQEVETLDNKVKDAGAGNRGLKLPTRF